MEAFEFPDGDGTFEEFFSEESAKLQLQQEEIEENQLDEIFQLEVENQLLKQDSQIKIKILEAQLMCLSKQNSAVLEYSNQLHSLLIGVTDGTI